MTEYRYLSYNPMGFRNTATIFRVPADTKAEKEADALLDAVADDTDDTSKWVKGPYPPSIAVEWKDRAHILPARLVPDHLLGL